MYNIGVANFTQNKLDVEVGFEPDNMPQYERNGSKDGLYNLVYVGGWHGGAWGAKGKDFNGPESVPHYRRPLWKWTQWGRAAEREEVPPMQYVETHWDEYIDKELSQEISNGVLNAYNSAIREAFKNLL